MTVSHAVKPHVDTVTRVPMGAANVGIQNAVSAVVVKSTAWLQKTSSALGISPAGLHVIRKLPLPTPSPYPPKLHW